MKKLPTTIFVCWAEPPNDQPWLSAKETIQDHAELVENRIVGEYRLVETLEVSAEIKTCVVMGKKLLRGK